MDADREETAPVIPVIAGEAESLWIMIYPFLEAIVEFSLRFVAEQNKTAGRSIIVIDCFHPFQGGGRLPLNAPSPMRLLTSVVGISQAAMPCVLSTFACPEVWRPQ